LPLLLSTDAVTEIGEYGPLLGGFDEVMWRDAPFDLEPGSALLSYTDGVTDAIGRDGTRYGPVRLRETLTGCTIRSASTVIETLGHALNDFQSGNHADDTAALVLRRNGRSRIPENVRDSGSEASANRVEGRKE
jgi:phosphoserine phosphatase RsbU/P